MMSARRLLSIVFLAAVWCALWREVSVANALVGLLIGAAVTGLAPNDPGPVRLAPLIKFGWMVLVDLVRSTVSVAVEIVTPVDRTEEAIIAVQLPLESRRHVLLLTVAVTLTPGTAVVEVDATTGTLYLHLLHYNRAAETRAHVEELARMACLAFPTSRQGAVA